VVLAVFARSSLSFPPLTAALVCLGALVAGCSPLQGAPSGTQCFSAVDCAAGLVCVPKGSISVCTNNITSIETEIDSGVEAASGETGPIMLADGSLKAGSDTGTPGTDTGTPPVDTGVPPVDTGTPPVDSGHDAGTPPVDASGAS